MTWGVTAAGFIMPQLSDILTEVNADLISRFGADINLDPQSFFGQIAGSFTEREAKVWQAMQDVYNSQTPDGAFGASLDNVGALRGIPRHGAKKSIIQNVKLFGTNGNSIPGSTTQFSVQNSPQSLFSLDSDTILGPGQNCIQTISFSSVPASGTWIIDLNGTETAPLAFNANAAAVQAAIQGLRFASGCTVTGNYGIGFTITFNGPGTGGLMIQPEFSVVSTLMNIIPAAVVVVPAITQAGIDQANVSVTAVNSGPTIANAGTLNVIATPLSGLTNVLSVQDAVIGQDVETDNIYLARQSTELQKGGGATFEALRSKLLDTNGVLNVLIFENDTDVIDGNGLPPHSFKCVVNGGTDADVANTIWLSKPTGINTFGTSAVDIVDSQGQTHTINFSRPTVKTIYIILNIQIDANFPANGDLLCKQALVNSGQTLGIGASVIVTPKLISAIGGIPGIETAELLIGTAPAPTLPNNIVIAATEVSTWDTGRIIVNHV